MAFSTFVLLLTQCFEREKLSWVLGLYEPHWSCMQMDDLFIIRGLVALGVCVLRAATRLHKVQFGLKERHLTYPSYFFIHS